METNCDKRFKKRKEKAFELKDDQIYKTQYVKKRENSMTSKYQLPIRDRIMSMPRKSPQPDSLSEADITLDSFMISFDNANNKSGSMFAEEGIKLLKV